MERAQDRLAAGPRLRSAADGDERRFALWDLASLVEGELGERVAPDALAPPAERQWRERLGESGREWPGGELYRRRYWVLDTDGSTVAGTVAVDNWTKGPGQLAVSSLYLSPEARGRGLAAAALDEVYAAATAEGLPGFRLEAHWTWQHAVRYYLRRGLWVVGWKHALALARMPQLPPYRVREEDDRLVLRIADRQRGWVPLLAAGYEGRVGCRSAGTRAGGETPDVPEVAQPPDDRWLRLDETADYRGADGWVHGYARSTLALYLALAGRPLVRGPQWWAEAWRWSDAGEPEGLAYKIGHFERTARAAGRRVVSPYRPTPAERPAPHDPAPHDPAVHHPALRHPTAHHPAPRGPFTAPRPAVGRLADSGDG